MSTPEASYIDLPNTEELHLLDHNELALVALLDLRIHAAGRAMLTATGLPDFERHPVWKHAQLDFGLQTAAKFDFLGTPQQKVSLLAPSYVGRTRLELDRFIAEDPTEREILKASDHYNDDIFVLRLMRRLTYGNLESRKPAERERLRVEVALGHTRIPKL